MNALVIAAESASTAPVGDDWTTAAWVLCGIAMVVTGITTWIITPKAEHH